MPYDKDKPTDVQAMREKLEKTYSNVSDTAVRQAIAVFNSVSESADEGKAWASVYSKMNERGLSKKANILLRDDILRVATKHPGHEAELVAIAKEAMGWIPGELKDRSYDTGHVDLGPLVHVEQGSQVPPPRDSLGNQLDADGNPVDSISRVKEGGDIEDAWARLAERTAQERTAGAVGQQIYLDRDQARKLGVDYDDEGTRLIAAADAILRSKNRWEGYDDYHIDLLKPLGGRTIVAEGQGYGWFKITAVR